MKKTVFIAALAVVAMASCTKNELKVPSTGTDAVISFQPVVANATKADYITNSTIAPSAEGTSTFMFKVYAWYTDGAQMTNSTTTATEYMSGVEVSYKSRHDDGTPGETQGATQGATQGQGGWSPENKYYWPKNGYLSFDAFAPSAASSDGTFYSNVAQGLQITNYTVKDLAHQYDLLYSTRTLNKTTSTGGNNGTYDGVDIAFHHALSAIEVTAKTGADYGNDAIKLKKITILNAYNNGNFTQGMSNAITENAPKWTPSSEEVSYVLFDENSGVALNQTGLSSSSETTPISNAILLPQTFAHTSNKVSIKVDYSIKQGDAYFDQTQTFDLSTTPVTSEGWVIGKKYTYNFIFSLEEIYFAPSVADWTDVTVDNINVQ